ncbi:hypothetical protein ACJIZ3_025087 [Penstemon smallii]|uniref:Uncharacterized protein n=1 Tax=Penstemon smallii TaxID=265156 RepID=A0ABD3TVC4_9LAMI
MEFLILKQDKIPNHRFELICWEDNQKIRKYIDWSLMNLILDKGHRRRVPISFFQKNILTRFLHQLYHFKPLLS